MTLIGEYDEIEIPPVKPYERRSNRRSVTSPRF
jgi:hypothetical protein